MGKKKQTFAGRITGRILIWMIGIVLCFAYVILHFEGEETRQFYSEIYRNKMIVNKEYTRRVISDVYVAVTNNIYYVEHTINNPDAHKETMERIVKSGTRVRSCGISFIEDYYPHKGHHFSPFAWRNVTNPKVVYSQDMGDADLDYLTADWFLNMLKSDSAQWSAPFFDVYDKKTPLSSYMVPIHDQSGRAVAVLTADISLDWLTRKLSEADTTINESSMFMANMFEMKSNSYIINDDGTYITNNDSQRILKDNLFDHLESCDGNSSTKELIKKLKNALDEDDVDGSIRLLVDGVECYLFYTPVKYTRWMMVTIVPCRSIDLLSYLNGCTLLVLFLLGMLLLVFVSYYFIRNGIAPLTRINTVADEVLEGKFDSRLPELKHNDEISYLRDLMEEIKYRLSNYSIHGKS